MDNLKYAESTIRKPKDLKVALEAPTVRVFEPYSLKRTDNRGYNHLVMQRYEGTPSIPDLELVIKYIGTQNQQKPADSMLVTVIKVDDQYRPGLSLMNSLKATYKIPSQGTEGVEVILYGTKFSRATLFVAYFSSKWFGSLLHVANDLASLNNLLKARWAMPVTFTEEDLKL